MISAVFLIIASTILLIIVLFGSDTLINICTVAIFSIFGILAVVGVVAGIVSLITGGTP